MNLQQLKRKIPLASVKPLCIIGVLAGIVFFTSGHWAAALCCMLGAYGFEKNLYCCPNCGKKLDMKYPLRHGSRCPACRSLLRE